VDSPIGLLDVYNTHLHANYSHQYSTVTPVSGDQIRVPKDVFAPYRLAQARPRFLLRAWNSPPQWPCAARSVNALHHQACSCTAHWLPRPSHAAVTPAYQAWGASGQAKPMASLSNVHGNVQVVLCACISHRPASGCRSIAQISPPLPSPPRAVLGPAERGA
jgi:hypothetical protein